MSNASQNPAAALVSRAAASTIHCLVVVDPIATLNGPVTVYMLDDNGDPNQGSNELNINAAIGDTIIFNITSLIPSWGCVLTTFTPGSGQAVITPTVTDGVWSGQVQNKGKLQYTLTFTINGTTQSFTWDPFITVG